LLLAARASAAVTAAMSADYPTQTGTAFNGISIIRPITMMPADFRPFGHPEN
jgi:hypothetical protein